MMIMIYIYIYDFMSFHSSNPCEVEFIVSISVMRNKLRFREVKCFPKVIVVQSLSSKSDSFVTPRTGAH